MKIAIISCALSGLLMCSCGGGDGSGVNDPPAGATVSGSVREQGSGSPIAGAIVTLGGVTATSGSNGEFELRNVPAGASLNLTVSAPGYDALTQSVNVQSGSNSVTLTLVRNGLFEATGHVVYLPPGVTAYRGVLIVLMGGTVDTRHLVRGELAYYQGLPLAGDVAGYRQRMLAFADANAFAVMGGAFAATDPTVIYAGISNALTTVANQSKHAELSNAPMLMHGHSARACFGYDFAISHPERMLGFIVGKAPCGGRNAAAAASIPAYFFVGQNDDQVSADAAAGIRAMVEQNRTRGALWAFAVEPNAGHAQVEDQDLLFSWMSTVATLRLPVSGNALRQISEGTGWLGDHSTYVIVPASCLPANASAASWLPSLQTAREWQVLVSRNTVTNQGSC